MSTNKNSKIGVTLRTDHEIDMFRGIMNQTGIKNITTWRTCHEAYEVASRKQFDFFLTAIKLEDQPGIVLLQKLRDTGNYGLEPHMFVGDRIDQASLNVFDEHDVEYVLTKPFTPERIINKLFYIFKQESSLSAQEQSYRDARTALSQGMIDMAMDTAQDALAKYGSVEKLEVLIAEILIQQGDSAKAREKLEQVIRKNPDTMHAQRQLAATYMAERDFEASKKILDKLSVENPNHIKVLENAGLSNYETGHLDLAKKQMEQVKTMDATNKSSAAVITKVKIAKGDYSNLASDLSESHTEKELVSLLNSAGIKLSKDDKIEEALAIYHDCLKVIKSEEFAGKVHYNIGLGYYRLKDKIKAAEHLAKAISFVPSLDKATKLLEKLDPKKKVA